MQSSLYLSQPIYFTSILILWSHLGPNHSGWRAQIVKKLMQIPPQFSHCYLWCTHSLQHSIFERGGGGKANFLHSNLRPFVSQLNACHNKSVYCNLYKTEVGKQMTWPNRWQALPIFNLFLNTWQVWITFYIVVIKYQNAANFQKIYSPVSHYDFVLRCDETQAYDWIFNSTAEFKTFSFH
jgi:hypothetical protein